MFSLKGFLVSCYKGVLFGYNIGLDVDCLWLTWYKG